MDTPKLAPFDPNLVDKTLDPCDDFYKYSCSKWLNANPIPSDQVFWSTGSGLQLWNENVLRDTLQAASTNDPKRTAVQQKIGDFWTSCMDESGIDAAGLKAFADGTCANQRAENQERHHPRSCAHAP